MTDPWANQRQRIQKSMTMDMYERRDMRELLADADALLAVVRLQEKLIALYEKDSARSWPILFSHDMNSPEEDVELGEKLRTEIADSLPKHLKEEA